MITGAGFGKTTFAMAAAVLLAHANPPGTVGLVLAPTYKMLHDVDQRSFERFMFENDIPFTAHRAESSYTLHSAQNEVLFRSVDQPDRIRGIDAAWEVGDEVADWERYGFQVALGRLRDPRATLQCFFGVGTPRGFDWVYEAFAEPGGKMRLPNSALVRAKASENFTLSNDYFEAQAVALDPELHKQEVDGQFIAIGQGSCYHAFDRARNLKDFEVDPNLPILLGCDFNIIDGGWVVSQGDPNKGIPLRAIDEIRVVGADSTNKACKEFLARYGKHPAGFHVYADFTGTSRKTTGYSDFEAIRHHLGVEARALTNNGPQKDRVAAVNALLLNAKGHVRLYVHPTKCPKLVRDFERVKWEPNGYQIDKSDHSLSNYSDAIGYTVACRFPLLADRSVGRRAA